MKYTVCVVTGTRAEFGLLEPLMRRLEEDSEIELKLVVCGSHLSPKFGNTQDEIIKNGFLISEKIVINLDGDSKSDMAVSTGEAIASFTKYFENNIPDLLVVLGDRYEIFAASFAAAIQGIPIAHIHGGETTQGAVDEFLRHSITKMSYLHFAACEEYRKRIIQLGEDPKRVFNVGALGVENALSCPIIPIHDIESDLGVEISEDYAIVTFHPVTQEKDTAEKQVRNLISAMDCFPEMMYIITKSNADAGGRLINRIWDEECYKHSNWVVVSSLGTQKYMSALRKAKMVIGNSSSGIIEAPAVHVPTVNIGDRQKGRIISKSVIDCDTDTNAIIKAIKKALSEEFRIEIQNGICPFGDGKSSELIYLKIRECLKEGIQSTKKSFYDLI